MTNESRSAIPHSTPERLVDALNGVFGKQIDNRAVHAKGVVLEGSFMPNPAASGLSMAPHLQKTIVPITVRFSDFAGVPTIPDTDPNATPRGMALKFHLPDGSETDIVAHSFNGFPSKASDDFRLLLIAVAASGPDAPAPKPVDAFFGQHPEAKAFFAGLPPPPVSYATLAYFGVNSFRFINAKGEATIGRYRIEPVAGAHFLDAAQIADAGHDYLIHEIGHRVTDDPVRFRLVAQIAAKDDAIDDPSIAWPDTRERIELGEIVITRLLADSAEAERRLMFQPIALPPGIEPADPMIKDRGDAYPVSYQRRHG